MQSFIVFVFVLMKTCEHQLLQIRNICNPARNSVPESIWVICMYLNQLLEILPLALRDAHKLHYPVQVCVWLIKCIKCKHNAGMWVIQCRLLKKLDHLTHLFFHPCVYICDCICPKTSSNSCKYHKMSQSKVTS